MTLSQKLQLKTGQSIRLVNQPSGLALDLAASAKADAVLLFVESVADLNRRAPAVLKSLPHDALLWIAYPKKTGRIKTDIHRDSGWDAVLQAGLQGVRMIAVDDTWSAMRFRPRARTKRRVARRSLRSQYSQLNRPTPFGRIRSWMMDSESC